MRFRRWAGSLTLLLAALLATHLYDLNERQALLKQFVLDRGNGTDRIVERYGLQPDQCVSEQQGELYPLAAALLTAESLATSRLEATARAGFARVATVLRTGVDISIGPGRIRPSTARRLIKDREGVDVPPGDPVLTERLLEPCGSLRIAILLLEDVRDRNGGETELKFVRLAASVYNGQSAPRRSLRADFAAQIYSDLVYNAFQHYRFLRHHLSSR
jgi:hypothetical protein